MHALLPSTCFGFVQSFIRKTKDKKQYLGTAQFKGLLTMYTVQYYRYGCTKNNVECSNFPSTVVMVNEISYSLQILCTACISSAV